VLFCSNLFDFDTNFFGSQPFLVFEERFLRMQEFSSCKLALSAFWQESFSFLQLVLRSWHLFSRKMLITATTAVTLPVLAVLIAISSALVVSLGAVVATLIGRGSVDK
jgi:hypothetical protein